MAFLLAGIAFVFTLMSATCRSRQSGEVSTEELTARSFVGPWIAATVDVEIHTKNGTGGSDHIHYDSQQLAAGQGRKPVQTIFNADGSYREDVYNLGDSLVQTKAGFWHLYEDSLFMRLDVQTSPKIAFRAKVEGKSLRLSSTMDWDGDGAKDDEMVVVLKRP
jgi:hypothetical protein